MQKIIEQAAAILCDFIDPDKLWKLQEAETEEEKAAVIYPLLRAYKETMQAADEKFNATEEEIEAAGGAAAIDQAINDRLNSMLDKEEINAAANAIAGRSLTPEKLADMMQSINDILGSEQYQQMKEFVEETKAAIEAFRTAQGGAKMHAATLAPFLKQVLEEDSSSYDLFDIIEHPKAKKYKAIIARAEEKREQFLEARKAVEDTELIVKELPRLKAIHAEKIFLGLDPLSNNLFNLPKERYKAGVAREQYITSKGKKNPNIYIKCILDMSGIETETPLTPYHGLIYSIFDALYMAGNEAITVSQIYKTMNNGRNGSAEDLENINTALTILRKTDIKINNDAELLNGRGYHKISLPDDDSLLPFKRKAVYMNGKFVDAACYPHCRPPLMDFAEQHNREITSIPAAMIDVPGLNKNTEGYNIAIIMYLAKNIAIMKNKGADKFSSTMLISTIREKCNIPKSVKRKRIEDKILKCVDYFRGAHWIEGYKLTDDKLIIKTERPAPKLQKRNKNITKK